MTSYDVKNRRWRIGGTVAAVVVTTVAGGVAWAGDLGGLTGAADPTPTPSVSPPSTPNPDQDKTDRPFRHHKFGFPGFGAPLHGEFVVEKEDGKYETVASQRGEVTEVSKESITVKSEDGFSRTYTLTEDTLVNAARDGIDDVKKGNQVIVMATVADGKATAKHVNDTSVRDAIHDKWGWGPKRPR